MYSSSFDFLEKNEDFKAILNGIKQTEIIYYFPPNVIANDFFIRLVAVGIRSYCESIVKYIMTVHELPISIKLDDNLSLLRGKDILHPKEKDAFDKIRKFGNGVHPDNRIKINDKIIRVLFEQSFLIAKWLFSNYFDKDFKLPQKYKKLTINESSTNSPNSITQANEIIDQEYYLKVSKINIQENILLQNKLLLKLEQKLKHYKYKAVIY